MPHKITPYLFLLFIICGAAAGGYYLYTKNQVTVTVITPIQGPAVQAVYATGTVEPVVMFPVAPRSASRLMELFHDEGSVVSKNTILARLEDTDLKTALADAKARVNLAQNNFNRLKDLVEIGGVSREAFDQAQTELESAQANMETINANLSYMTLLAPDDGTVIRRDGEIGELITAGQTVFWLAGKEMRVEAEVDEEDIALVKPGQKTLIHADAYPDEIFEGTVQSITPKGDPIARSYRVRIALNDNTKLMIGMTAESNIIIREEDNALLIPISSIEDGHVWVIERNKPVKKSVKTGVETLDAVEILDGISLSDSIIQNPPSDLTTNSDIEVIKGSWELP